MWCATVSTDWKYASDNKNAINSLSVSSDFKVGAGFFFAILTNFLQLLYLKNRLCGVEKQTKTSVLKTEVIVLMVAGPGLEPGTSWL